MRSFSADEIDDVLRHRTSAQCEPAGLPLRAAIMQRLAQGDTTLHFLGLARRAHAAKP
jgi:hypothetical protein